MVWLGQEDVHQQAPPLSGQPPGVSGHLSWVPHSVSWSPGRAGRPGSWVTPRATHHSARCSGRFQGGVEGWMGGRDGQTDGRVLDRTAGEEGGTLAWVTAAGWGPRQPCTCGRVCPTSVTPRTASATAPCWARPSLSAAAWWMLVRTWPPVSRTCAVAPAARAPPLLNTPASVPTRGASRRTGGAPTSAVSVPLGPGLGRTEASPESLGRGRGPRALGGHKRLAGDTAGAAPQGRQ